MRTNTNTISRAMYTTTALFLLAFALFAPAGMAAPADTTEAAFQDASAHGWPSKWEVTTEYPLEAPTTEIRADHAALPGSEGVTFSGSDFGYVAMPGSEGVTFSGSDFGHIMADGGVAFSGSDLGHVQSGSDAGTVVVAHGVPDYFVSSPRAPTDGVAPCLEPPEAVQSGASDAGSTELPIQDVYVSGATYDKASPNLG